MYSDACPYRFTFSATGVVRINSFEGELIERIGRIETAFTKRLARIEDQLSAGETLFGVFSDGMWLHKERLLRELGFSAARRAFDEFQSRIRADKTLRFPHRKILDVLMDQYDHAGGRFKWINFSRLVQDSRVGKNAAKSYLSTLERNGWIDVRSDGYRKWFRMRHACAEPDTEWRNGRGPNRRKAKLLCPDDVRSSLGMD